MPNLVTVKKLYLQIKVIPLSMSLMLNTKVSVNSCLVFLKGKKETRWILLVWILIVSNIYDPCQLSKSWTQLFLKRPKLYLVGNGSWSPISMLDLRSNKTNKEANLEEKYQMKSHPALNIELKKKKKKNSSNWIGSRKKKMSETTNWLRLRSHHTSFKSCRRFVPFCSYTMKIHTDTDSTS